MSDKPCAPHDRILRAIEEITEEKVDTRDFEIPAAYLRASEVWAPMSGPSDVLISDDNVIPLRDSIKSIEALVGWLTRDIRFEITDDNVRDLAHLSDKYMIPSLQKDIRMYVLRYIIRKEAPTLDLWKFAARYSLFELESYCRDNSDVLEKLKEVLRDHQRGLHYFLEYGVPSRLLSTLVADIAKESETTTNRLIAVTKELDMATSKLDRHCNNCNMKTKARVNLLCTRCNNWYG